MTVRSHRQEVFLTGQLLTLCFLEVRGHTDRDSEKPQYLIGGSSVHVPPQPSSYWSRDGQLVGGEVFCLLRVCGRKQSAESAQTQRKHDETLRRAREEKKTLDYKNLRNKVQSGKNRTFLIQSGNEFRSDSQTLTIIYSFRTRSIICRFFCIRP